jgi:transposase-like protein
MEPTCPACGAEDDHIVLGSLGYLDHYRCRQCGIDFSRDNRGSETEEPIEEDES